MNLNEVFSMDFWFNITKEIIMKIFFIITVALYAIWILGFILLNNFLFELILLLLLLLNNF